MRVRSTLTLASFLLVAGIGAASAQPGSRPATARDMIGRWTSQGDCRDWIQYSANGTWRGTGGSRGEWVVEDGHLTAGPGMGASVRLMPDGSITVQMVNYDITNRLVRCPTPARRRR